MTENGRMTTETITVTRSADGILHSVDNIDALRRLMDEYKNEELKHDDQPGSYEAEISAGLKFFGWWLERKMKTQ